MALTLLLDPFQVWKVDASELKELGYSNSTSALAPQRFCGGLGSGQRQALSGEVGKLSCP